MACASEGLKLSRVCFHKTIHDHRLFPTLLEMPQIEAVELETDDPIGPFDAKEAGDVKKLRFSPPLSQTNTFNKAGIIKGHE